MLSPPPLAVITGTAVTYIVILLVVLRLMAGRVVPGSWIPVFDGFASIALGAMSLGFLNPGGLPVAGLAFAGIGILHESRDNNRTMVFVVLAIGAILSTLALFISLRHAGHD
jgi:hypothetical protein